MRGKVFLRIVGCLVWALFGFADTSNAHPPGEPPNIILILADDLGLGDLRCYNTASRIPTPEMDRLASEGVRFANAYAPAAICVPSRYGLLTGRYPFRGAPLSWNRRPTIAEGMPTIGSVLQLAGYETYCIGKWHEGFNGIEGDLSEPLTGGPIDRGFDHFFGQAASLDQAPYYYIEGRRAVQIPSLETPGSGYPRMGVEEGGRFWREGAIAPGFVHEDVLQRYAQEAMDRLHAMAEREERDPFFLCLALTAPHHPWLPGNAFRGTSGAGAYGDFVAEVDAIVGRIRQALDELELGSNTLLIVTSDNGPAWSEGDRAVTGHDAAGGLRGRKGDIWEGGIRMPMLVRWPGVVPAGSVAPALVGQVDFLATFAELGGAEASLVTSSDSESFLEVLKRPETSAGRESILLSSLGPQDLAVRLGDWKWIPWLGSGGFLSGPKRLDPEPGAPDGQLYNLREDPAETHNLAAQFPARVEALERELDRLQKEFSEKNPDVTE